MKVGNVQQLTTNNPILGSKITKNHTLNKIIAIDPGPVQSGWVVWDGAHIYDFGIWENKTLLRLITSCEDDLEMVVEQVRSYGMPVGASVFDTVFWSGRFCEAFGEPFHLMPRLEVKKHICNNGSAKDSNIIQALVDRFAYGQRNRGKGTKKENGFFYGFKADIWQAFALAVTFWDQQSAIKE